MMNGGRGATIRKKKKRSTETGHSKREDEEKQRQRRIAADAPHTTPQWDSPMLGFWLMSSPATFFHCAFFDSRFTHCVPSTTARKDSQKAAGRDDRRGRARGWRRRGADFLRVFTTLSKCEAKDDEREKKKLEAAPKSQTLCTSQQTSGELPSHTRRRTTDSHRHRKNRRVVGQYAELRKPRFQLDDGLKHFFSNDPFHYCSFSSLAQW